MESNLEVLLSPAELPSLAWRDLSRTACVVFDVLRATSSMLTALNNGASRIFPALEISDALALHRAHPDALLAGERNSLRISRAQTGSVDFDLGNSPREFTRERVAGREIIMTTTNGTRALQACRGAQRVLVGAFLNLRALAGAVQNEGPTRLLVICAGTLEEAAYEDVLAAGALCALLWPQFESGQIADSAFMARQLYLNADGNLEKAALQSRNARRLLAIPALAPDVAYCLQRDTLNLTAELRDGSVTVPAHRP